MLQKGLSFPKPLAKSRGQVKKFKIPPLQKEGGGQELNANVNGLANLETLQVGNFESHVEDIKQLLSLKIQCFKAGNISKFYSTWLELTSDPEVLYTVKDQSIEFTTTPYQDQVPVQKKFSAEESNIIQCEINKLLQKEIIKSTSHEPGQFISAIFLRPKRDGMDRMILNLKKLNESVKYDHFKMDTLWMVIRMMKHNCYMASVDIKDAYYSVPIADTDQKYLTFEWRGILYKFTCFPNGLALCPRKFTKLLKPVCCYPRKKGHLSSGCIDDSYLQGDGYQDCLANVLDTTKLIHWGSYFI